VAGGGGGGGPAAPLPYAPAFGGSRPTAPTAPTAPARYTAPALQGDLAGMYSGRGYQEGMNPYAQRSSTGFAYQPQQYQPQQYQPQQYQPQQYQPQQYQPQQYQPRQYQPRQYQPNPYEQLRSNMAGYNQVGEANRQYAQDMGAYMGKQKQYGSDVGAYNRSADEYNTMYGDVSKYQGYTPVERIASATPAQDGYWQKQSKTYQDRIAELERQLATYSSNNSGGGWWSK